MSDNSRREFLLKAAQTMGIALSAPAAIALLASCEQNETLPPSNVSTVTVDISKHPELSAPGGIIQTSIKGLNQDNGVFVTRVSATDFVVFSTICTHQGCPLSLPTAPGANCVCPCHSAEYSSTDGTVNRQPTSGSATNLPKFASAFDSATNILTITT